MATAVENVQILFGALADFKGVTLSNQRKIAIVEEYIYLVAEDATNEDKATLFLQRLIQHIQEQGVHNVVRLKEAELSDQVSAAKAAAASNME